MRFGKYQHTVEAELLAMIFAILGSALFMSGLLWALVFAARCML